MRKKSAEKGGIVASIAVRTNVRPLPPHLRRISALSAARPLACLLDGSAPAVLLRLALHPHPEVSQRSQCAAFVCKRSEKSSLKVFRLPVRQKRGIGRGIWRWCGAGT